MSVPEDVQRLIFASKNHGTAAIKGAPAKVPAKVHNLDDAFGGAWNLFGKLLTNVFGGAKR